MAIRLARSLAASSSLPSSFPSLFRLGIWRLTSDISAPATGRVVAFSSSSSSWTSPEDLTAASKRRGKNMTDRLSSVIDAVNDRKLPPELRGQRNSVRVFARQFSSDTKRVNTKVNFSPSDDDSEEETSLAVEDAGQPKKLPPPYDPFNKKPVLEEPEDPKDLQAVFHKMKTGGLTNEAVKMFDALSKDGLTHEALELFSQIKDKGHMPDVVAHTAIVEAYAKAGQPNEALKVFMRMLACGVAPNAYTYTVLIKGLARDAKSLGDAKKYLLEMLEKGIRPNATTYLAVFEAFVREQKEDSSRELLKEMEEKGFVPNEKAVREVLQTKRGQVFRTVISILFDK
ncbi:PREDICTED: pentatricopeptide repeat-containing protein At4g38150 isoform X1 [Tarenaya hassleriana]|uniref:pentatricopeptide repeat-containing protein At4g38150 isoform X1 n=1 Tax=Tarenaya hassleriana TaxID=28532 RepID=UPI00053C49A6|nr:PREDICTED: pentatricopeptide repeat-containing protein At4g38150 isoform X1 [Tarenaya hassleriana]